MDYSHTIAIARDLLSQGRYGQASELLQSVEGRERPGDADALLRAYTARARLLGDGVRMKALELLQGYRRLANRAHLGACARAEVSIWMAWSTADAGDRRSLVLALSLLSDAARFAERQPLPDVAIWAAIGRARVFDHLGHPEAAAVYDRAARTMLAETPVPAAEAWLSSGTTQDSRPPDEADPLRWSGMRSSAVTLETLLGAGLPVLLVGESGVGKKRAALTILGSSPPDASAVQQVDCASLVDSASLDALQAPVDTEPVGSRVTPRPWFLCNVDLTPIQSQQALAELLLRESEAGRRIVATSHRWLDDLSGGVDFVDDLYEALHACSVELAPLRMRRQDIPRLIRETVRELTRGDDPGIVFTDDALHVLARADWPGNVTELRAEIGRLVEMAAVDPLRVIGAEDLKPEIAREARRNGTAPETARLLENGEDLSDIMDRIERVLIEQALHTADGHVASAADALGLSRQGLYKKMKRLDIDLPRSQTSHVLSS